MNILDEIGSQELLNNVVTLSEAKMKFGRETQRRKDSLDTSRSSVATANKKVRVRTLNATIKQEDGKYFVFSKDGDKKLSKGYDNKKDALGRLGEIESFKKKNASITASKKESDVARDEKIKQIIAKISGQAEDCISKVLNIVSSSKAIYPKYMGGKELEPYGESLRIGCGKLSASLKMKPILMTINASLTDERRFKIECINVESQLVELLNSVPVDQVGLKRNIRALLSDLQPFKKA